MKTRATRILVSAGLAVFRLLLWPTAVSAHPMPGVGDFYAGVLHPLTAIECLLPMIALGLLAGQQVRKSAILMLAAFPPGLTAGAALGSFAPAPTVVGWINLGSMAVLGLLVAARRSLPPIVAVALSTVLGITIGVANGSELGSQVSAYRFIPGLALAGLFVVAYGIGSVRALRPPWLQIGFRVLGSWIAAVGILVLALK
ncbi:MAG TPA: HupE/UreJ family protein [Terriglobia bacterium]|nr:HupE/UreJ family protein [Terriglobia bacterium]